MPVPVENCGFEGGQIADAKAGAAGILGVYPKIDRRTLFGFSLIRKSPVFRSAIAKASRAPVRRE